MWRSDPTGWPQLQDRFHSVWKTNKTDSPLINKQNIYLLKEDDNFSVYSQFRKMLKSGTKHFIYVKVIILYIVTEQAGHKPLYIISFSVCRFFTRFLSLFNPIISLYILSLNEKNIQLSKFNNQWTDTDSILVYF